MATCLLALGSNVGDREATLREALAAIDATPGVALQRQSGWYATAAVGGPPNQGEFINAAAVVECSLGPAELLATLHQIESLCGRHRRERWAARTCDIDLILYGDQVIRLPGLNVPHPNMSFRRFVLQPAAEIAGEMIHPTIGWSIERLLSHLQHASDLVAILSPLEPRRIELATTLADQIGGAVVDVPTFEGVALLWPQQLTSWVRRGGRNAPAARVAATGGAALRNREAHDQSPPVPAADFPKLSVILDCGAAEMPAVISDWTGPIIPPGISVSQSERWSDVLDRPGRGPTLHLDATDMAHVYPEVFAAVQAVWPDEPASRTA